MREGLGLAEAELGGCAEVVGGEVLGEKLGPGSGGDHGSVVGGEGERGKGDGEAAAVGFGLEAAAKFAVGGYSTGDDDAASAERFRGSEGLALEIANDSVLEGSDEVEGLLVAELSYSFVFWSEIRVNREVESAGFDALSHVVSFDVAENGGLDAAKGEVEVRAFGAAGGFFVGGGGAVAVDAGLDLTEGEGDCSRVAVRCEGVDPGATGVAEAEKLGYLVVGFPSSVVDRAAYVAVGPGALGSLLLR